MKFDFSLINAQEFPFLINAEPFLKGYNTSASIVFAPGEISPAFWE